MMMDKGKDKLQMQGSSDAKKMIDKRYKQYSKEAWSPNSGKRAEDRNRTCGMSQVDSLRDCPLYCSSLYTWIHVCNYLSMINEHLLIVNQQSTISSQWGKIEEWADCIGQSLHAKQSFQLKKPCEVLTYFSKFICQPALLQQLLGRDSYQTWLFASPQGCAELAEQ